MTLGAPSPDTPRDAAERRKSRFPYPPHGRCRFRDGPRRGARVFIKNDSLLTEVESCAPPRRPSRALYGSRANRDAHHRAAPAYPVWSGRSATSCAGGPWPPRSASFRTSRPTPPGVPGRIPRKAGLLPAAIFGCERFPQATDTAPRAFSSSRARLTAPGRAPGIRVGCSGPCG